MSNFTIVSPLPSPSWILTCVIPNVVISVVVRCAQGEEEASVRRSVGKEDVLYATSALLRERLACKLCVYNRLQVISKKSLDFESIARVLAYSIRSNPSRSRNILYRFWKLLLVPVEGELG